ncbi:MAG: outer membrane protein [Bauldia sp.]
MTRNIVAGVAAAAAAGLVALGAGSASAQTAAYDWNGFYLGLTTGWGVGKATYTFNTKDFFGAAGESFTQPLSGMPIGGYAGYNFDVPGPLVVGIEASVQSAFVWLHGEGPTGLTDDSTAFSRVHYWATLGPRIGWANGRALFYLEAGPALGHVISELENDTKDLVGFDQSAFRVGYFAGLGVDFAITDRVTIGVGIRRINLGAAHMEGDVRIIQNGDPVGTTDYEFRTRFTSVLVRIGFNF